jgi:hypothetical protein
VYGGAAVADSHSVIDAANAIVERATFADHMAFWMAQHQV